MTFNLLNSAWFFLLAIPLIAFYFLKLRRQRIEVPSLVLWQQVLQDSRVNSPFQKFKRNLLLLFQLLLLCLLILAAMDPIMSGTTGDQRVPILVDCSASMAVLKEGKPKLEHIKESLYELIDSKRSDQEMAIISFAQNAQKLCSFTRNKQILKSAVNALQVVDLESQLEPALKVTQALTKSGTFSEALLFTDGNFKDVPTFDLSFKINYQLIKSATHENIGVSRLSARRAGSESWMIFIQTDASESYQHSTTLEVFQDKTKVAEDTFSSVEMKTNKFSFKVDGRKPSLIHVRLTPHKSDVLASDNDAWIDLSMTRPLQVFLPDSLNSITAVLQNIPGINISNDPSSKYDLSFSHTESESSIETTVHFSLGYIPADLSQLVESFPQQSSVIDWDRGDPLLQHVNLNDVLLMNAYKMTGDNRPLEVEKKSYQILATGKEAPLIIKRDQGFRIDYHCLFKLDQTTLPYKVAFPILLTNLINESLLKVELAEKNAATTGFIPEITSNSLTAYKLKTPKGAISGKASETGLINGLQAQWAGNYTLSSAASVEPQTFYASLLSPLESRLESIESVQFNETSISMNNEEVSTDKPLWSQLTLLAFLLLIFEWWFYQKKPSQIIVNK